MTLPAAHSSPSTDGYPRLTPEELLTLGRGIIEEESKALASLATNLPTDFVVACQAILGRNEVGKVITVGIGKAGYVAQKISATLASVGIASFFLHPSEASHGDLGRLTKADITVIFSNSGETEEIVRLLPAFGPAVDRIIAITGHEGSTLARHADITLCVGNLPEACPLNLAPSTTTAVMLALGDALALTVSHAEGLSRASFARNHPGGSLGRMLMPVAEVMRTGESHCIVPVSLSTREAIDRYTRTPGRPGAATIVAEDGTVAGIFTDGNLRRLLTSGIDFLSAPIGEVMTSRPKSISSEVLARDALEILSTYQIDQVIVVDRENKPLGLVDIQDVARMFRGLE